MDNEKRVIENYVIEQSIFIGDREVLFGVDESKEFPFMVCYCSDDNPLAAPIPMEAIASNEYLEAMEVFMERVSDQIEQVRAEQIKFKFGTAPFTRKDCILDDKSKSIVGKVIVIDARKKRYEYKHSAYQLIYVEGGNGALGGRGQAVFGRLLPEGNKVRYDRGEVLGEIKPECMPAWAKESLVTIQQEIKVKKKNHER